MRIALIHNYYLERGGEDSVFEDEKGLLRDHGHDVISLKFDNRDLADWSTAARLTRPIWNGKSYRRVLATLERHRIDIAHIHNTLAVASPAVFHAARAAGAAVVQTMHNFRMVCLNGLLYRKGGVCESCLRWRTPLPGVIRGCYRNSRVASAGVAAIQTSHTLMGTWRNKVDLYLAPTEFVRQKLIEGGISAEAIAIKPHFLLEEPSAALVPYASRFKARPSVVFVGRLAAEKGIETLLKAWPLMADPRAELVIVGDGPLAADVTAAACKDGRIRATGRLASLDTRRYLASAALVVVPSDCYESFGRVAIEAFAAGTPVLVSGHGSLASIVRDGREGRHFRPGDAEDLARQIAALLEGRQEAERLSLSARRRFEEEFTAERNYKMMMEIYERALRAARSGIS